MVVGVGAQVVLLDETGPSARTGVAARNDVDVGETQEEEVEDGEKDEDEEEEVEAGE